MTSTLALLFRSRTSVYGATNCGHNAATARARGCIFEPMMRARVAAECHTDEPRQEHDLMEDRSWFLDYKMMKPMNAVEMQIMRTGDDIVGYTKFLNDEHYLYAWYKPHLTIKNKHELLNSKSMSLEHSTHCSKQIDTFLYNPGTYAYNVTGNYTSIAPRLYLTFVPLFWKPWPWSLLS